MRRSTREALLFFTDVIERLDAIIVASGDRVDELLAGAPPLVAELCAHRVFLHELCAGTRQVERQPALRGQTFRYPLYTADTGAYSLHAGIFAPGGESGVHDHGTWGVVGVWQGEEYEERFARVDGALRCVRTTVNGAGRLSLLVPDADETHRLANRSAAPAYSLHLYGRALRPSRTALSA